MNYRNDLVNMAAQRTAQEYNLSADNEFLLQAAGYVVENWFRDMYDFDCEADAMDAQDEINLALLHDVKEKYYALVELADADMKAPGIVTAMDARTKIEIVIPDWMISYIQEISEEAIDRELSQDELDDFLRDDILGVYYDSIMSNGDEERMSAIQRLTNEDKKIKR